MKKLLLVPLLFLSVAQADVFQCKVHNIIDGDRLICLDAQQQQVTILLANVDAPEIGQAYGEQAKQILSERIKDKTINFLAVNPELFCTRAQDMDKKGWICADVGLEGYLTEPEISNPEQSVNYQMIEQGHAWLAPSPIHLLGMTVYHKAEHDAQEGKKGLWADTDPVAPWQWREKNSKE